MARFTYSRSIWAVKIYGNLSYLTRTLQNDNPHAKLTKISNKLHTKSNY